MKKAWFYEILFFKGVMVMVKDEKKKDTMSIIINVSFMHYIKWTRVILPVVFEEFEVVYIFKLLFSFHYHY